MKAAFMTLPWWVRWIGIPTIALVVFGGLIISVITWVLGLAFRVLIFAALVAVLIFVVRKFTSSSSS
ncbi:hypothetical protein E1265_36125, partial [Streptomyces sp. 8K308]|uniref:DUF5326 family protein n=1 Tax=Streptomyces sp. 8K308 TaxID=2530388 RepID=UPI00105405CA